MSKQKKNVFPFIVIGAVLVIVLGLAQYFATQDAAEPQESEVVQEEVVSAEPESTIDVAAALSDRIIGNPQAPVKISEHSSLTCGHCGHFHKETWKPFKEAYIDTGKVYVVFSDFPLNAPAMHASMIARCLPAEQHEEFVQMLFETQEDWAYDATAYLPYLKKKSGEYGLSGDDFEACLQSKELQEGIVNRLKASQTQWQISSTPSFVINNKRTITGALPFEEFSKIIDEELGGSQEEPASAAMETPAEDTATEDAAPETEENTPDGDVHEEEALEYESAPDETITPDEGAPEEL